jgi:hypothetical protein
MTSLERESGVATSVEAVAERVSELFPRTELEPTVGAA